MYKLYLQIMEIYETILSYMEDMEENNLEDITLDIRSILEEINICKRLLRKFNVNALDVTPELKAHIATKINTVKGDIEPLQKRIMHSYYYDEYFTELESGIFNYLKQTHSFIDNASEARRMTDFLLHPDNVDTYLSDIKKIIRGVMPVKTFNMLHTRFLTKTRPNTSKHVYYNESATNEGFYNPYDIEEEKPKKETINIADKGGMLSKRRQIFDKGEIEYEKTKKGYSLFAKTNFNKGDIVETCPIIFIESKDVNDKLNSLLFDLGNDKYALVLGYGCLYKHSYTPNVEYAFNSSNKQMYFIASKNIKRGEELFINYGEEYMNNHTQNEDSANAVDQPAEVYSGGIAGINNIKAVSSPVNPNNPAYKGLPTLGAQF